jgi:hypothetical protein
MTLRRLIFVDVAVCDAGSGVRYQKTFRRVFRLKCSTVIGCCVIMTFVALPCVSLGVSVSEPAFFFVPSYWSLSWSRNFPYIMGPDHVFVLIDPCIEPDQSTPRTHPLSHTRLRP